MRYQKWDDKFREKYTLEIYFTYHSDTTVKQTAIQSTALLTGHGRTAALQQTLVCRALW